MAIANPVIGQLRKWHHPVAIRAINHPHVHAQGSLTTLERITLGGCDLSVPGRGAAWITLLTVDSPTVEPDCARSIELPAFVGSRITPSFTVRLTVSAINNPSIAIKEHASPDAFKFGSGAAGASVPNPPGNAPASTPTPRTKARRRSQGCSAAVPSMTKTRLVNPGGDAQKQ